VRNFNVEREGNYLNNIVGAQNSSPHNRIVRISLYLSLVSFVMFPLYLLVRNDHSEIFIPFKYSVSLSPLIAEDLLFFGVDIISISLMILTNLFIYLCILSIRYIELKKKFSSYNLITKLFFIQWGLLGAFSSLDLISFFIFFEATLIPIFMIILQGGSRERKTRASYLIAIYTLFGSIFMLFNIIFLYNKYGTTNYL